MFILEPACYIQLLLYMPVLGKGTEEHDEYDR